MKCKNQEKFSVSTIIFDETYVKDTEGNIMFRLNNYIYQKQFACEVGILDSKIKKKLDIEPSSTTSSTLPSSITPSPFVYGLWPE